MAVATIGKIGKTTDMINEEDEEVVEDLRRSLNSRIDDLNEILAALDARITTLEP